MKPSSWGRRKREHTIKNTFKMIKNLTKALTLVIGMIGLSLTSNAQTATGNASATIISPIGLTAETPMAFGSVMSGQAGTVQLPVSGGPRVATDVALSSIGISSAATFSVTGEANYTYSISLPATATLTHSNAVDVMTVNNFLTDQPENIGTLSGTGNGVFTVGATLNVGAGQLSGQYLGTYDVTVAYN